MSISAIDPITIASTTHRVRHPGQSAFKAVEDLLGMKPNELRAALDSGKSLVDLAAEKGISKDDLVKAIATAIRTDRPGISADQATQLATRIATQVPKAGAAGAAGGPAGVGGPPPPSDDDDTASTTGAVGKHHRHHHHHAGTETALDAVSGALGMQTLDLVTALKSGQTLGQLATSKGITEDALLASIASALGPGGSAEGDGSYGSSASTSGATGTLVNSVA